MSKFIDKAKQYLGVRGGSNTHKNLVDYYNVHCYPLVYKDRLYKIKYSDDWCAMFVSVVAHKVGIHKFPTEVSVYYMWQRAKIMGLTRTKPKVNDLIIFSWKNNGVLNHVGIVKSISGNTITTIEGNRSNKVNTRTINIGNSMIYGYIHTNIPKPSTTAPDTTTKPVVTFPSNRTNKLAREVLNGWHGTGEDRKKSFGSEYATIQKRVNQLIEIDRMADEVMNGDHGVGEDRKKSLGKHYDSVQNRINELH